MDPKRAINGTFCPIPWTGFIMNPDGEVKNCVLSNQTLGNINDTDIQDILHGDINTKIKQCMHNDQQHAGCANCYKLEQGTTGLKNVRSDRYYYLKSLSGVPYSAYNTENTTLSTVDMRWRNTCNLACVYCGPELSSTWAKEVDREISVDEQQLAKTKKYVLDNAPNLKNVYLAGGEPLLMKENSELLDRLDPSCVIRINTNLSNIKGPVFERISKFKNVHWTVSVETMDTEFEYIRYGANWETFLENSNVIKQLDHKISFNMLWFVLNPYSVFDTVDYFMQSGYAENAFIIGPVTDPIEFDIRNLNTSTLNDLRNILRNRIQQADMRYLLHNSYVNMLKHLDEKFDKQSSKTIQRLEELDKRRELNYKNVFDIDKYL
jgi:radical SAM protein with 4Fe4S-binding SPASM domain